MRSLSSSNNIWDSSFFMMFHKLTCKSLLVALCAISFSVAQAESIKESDLPTLKAVQKCLAEFSDIVENQRIDQMLNCHIPIDVDKAELDTLLKSAFKFKSLKSQSEKFANHSAGAAKLLANIQSAQCELHINMSGAHLSNTLNTVAETKREFSPLPVSCNVETNSGRSEKVSFDLRPKVKVGNQCIVSFKPQMGNIKAPCKLCWPVKFSRLAITTNALALVINRMGGEMAPFFNRFLNRNCVKSQ